MSGSTKNVTVQAQQTSSNRRPTYGLAIKLS